MQRSRVLPPAARRRAKTMEQFYKSVSGRQQTILEWALVKPVTTLRLRTAAHDWLQFGTDANAKLRADAEVDEALALCTNHWRQTSRRGSCHDKLQLPGLRK